MWRRPFARRNALFAAKAKLQSQMGADWTPDDLPQRSAAPRLTLGQGGRGRFAGEGGWLLVFAMSRPTSLFAKLSISIRKVTKREKPQPGEWPTTLLHLSQRPFKHKLWLVNKGQGPPDWLIAIGSQLWSCLNFRMNSQTERAQTAGKVRPPTAANAVQWKSLETTASWAEAGGGSFSV